MQIAEYYTIRRAVQDNAPAADENAASALQIELRAALRASGLFHTVEVGRTDDADRLVIAMCRFAPGLESAQVADMLGRLWSKQVAYGFWNAGTVLSDKGHAELQGATRVSLGGHYVTVHVVAQEAPVPAPVLVRRSSVLRETPSTGIVRQPAPAPRVRRARGWFTGRPDVTVA